MTHLEFDALVSRLEAYAQRAPGHYKMRVALLACLGYAYLFFILACLLAMLGLVAAAILLGKGSLIFLKLAIAPAAVAGAILSSLKVTLPLPQGLRLDRAEAPELFHLLDEVRAVLKVPSFHRVLLTDDFNAAVAQVPRFGVFGWQQNFLLLGLPLMQALTPEQFRAVLAHETGHLSGNLGRFAAGYTASGGHGFRYWKTCTKTSRGARRHGSAASSAGMRLTSARTRSCWRAATSIRRIAVRRRSPEPPQPPRR